MTAPTTHVLHVVDRIGGGVPVAVAGYIGNSPDGFRHSILAPFVDGRPAPVWDGVEAGFHDLGSGTLGRIVRVRRAVRELAPGVVHAHSSFAGVYARLALPSGTPRRVYSPHCFAFERADVGPLRRRLFRAVESVLGRRTELLASCGDGERSLAEQLPSLRGRTDVVPNVASLPPAPPSPAESRPLLAMAGRVSAQKDPAFLARTVLRIRAAGHDVDAVWLGDGDDRLAAELGRSRIEVSGWLDGEQLAARLSRATAYLHTAAWEGFPIAVLDAHARGVPILVRRIRAFQDAPAAVTIEEGLDGLIAALGSREALTRWSTENRAAWAAVLADNTRERQTAALARVWGAV